VGNRNKSDSSKNVIVVIKEQTGEMSQFGGKAALIYCQPPIILMGILNTKNYFIRVNFSTNRDYFKSLNIALQQVLYHSRYYRF